MTYFNHENVMPRTKVFDVDTNQEIKQVVHIETDTGYLEYHPVPFEIVLNQFVSTKSMRYRSIYPIYGGYQVPCLFHCYGRLN
jgi:hypothetical protein